MPSPNAIMHPVLALRAGIKQLPMQIINWALVGVCFLLILLGSIFGLQVLGNNCANEQFFGSTDDKTGTQEFKNWQNFFYGCMGVAVSPIFVLLVWGFLLLSNKNPWGYASALAIAMLALFIVMEFISSESTQVQAVSIGAAVGVALLGGILSSNKKTSTKTLLTTIGIILLVFCSIGIVQNSVALDRKNVCDKERGCDSALSSGDARVCDNTCCPSDQDMSKCTEYQTTDSSNCVKCQPCVIDADMTTKLWACNGISIGLWLTGLGLLIGGTQMP